MKRPGKIALEFNKVNRCQLIGDEIVVEVVQGNMVRHVMELETLREGLQ
jgi:hypothetical protein